MLPVSNLVAGGLLMTYPTSPISKFLGQLMPESISIRPALSSEATYLSELALRSKAHWGYTPEFIEGCREELSYSPGQVSDSEYLFFVADRSEEILGFYALCRMFDTTCYLEAMFVEPKEIGRGIGQALMDHAKQTAIDCGAESIVVQSDPNAASFYTAAGGSITGQEESTVTPGRFLPVFSIPLAHSDLD